MTDLARTRQILAELIAYPTISVESNLDLVAFAGDLLSKAGARLLLQQDATGRKVNLFATLGPEGDGGIVLSGHTDVVPVDGQDWSSDPFRLLEKEGRLYGRGSCDMKGFIACCLAMAPAFAALPLKRPVHFAFTYDEEVGCLGARALLQELEKIKLRPSAAIIGEPTSMRIIEAHKGCYEYTTEFTGLEGHGSVPDRGVNAIEYAVRYIARLLQLAEELKARAPDKSRFHPPWTTLQIGHIAGGSARNVIAGHCSVEWEMRPVQAADIDFVKQNIEAYVDDVLKPAMREVSAQADIMTHVIGEVDGLEPVTYSEARRIVSELTGLSEAGVVAFGTEAGLYQNAGISAIICGPGSIAQAHKADEYITIEQLSACIEMLKRLGTKLVS